MWLGDIELEDNPLEKLVPTACNMGSQCSSEESEKEKKNKQVTEIMFAITLIIRVPFCFR